VGGSRCPAFGASGNKPAGFSERNLCGFTDGEAAGRATTVAGRRRRDVQSVLEVDVGGITTTGSSELDDTIKRPAEPQFDGPYLK